MQEDKNGEHIVLNMKESMLVTIGMFTILGVMIIKYHLAPQVPILLVFTIILFYGYFRGFTWDEILDGIVEGIKPGIIPIIIFLMIGLLVSTWLASGTIATIMVIGFKIISVKFFLPTVFLTCGLIGITVGSAFTTISSMGIAFMGIGHVLGFSDAMTAGAIVSGAFFGNNMSPLSDTSNLTTGLTGVNLYVHLKNIMYSAVPTAVISMIIFSFFGSRNNNVDFSKIKFISDSLTHDFNIGFWALLPIIVLLLFAWKKFPAIPTLLISSLTAIVIIVVNGKNASITNIGNLIMNGNESSSAGIVGKLMSGGGINNMLGSISLILCALSLGGLLIKFGVLNTLIDGIRPFMKTPGKIILSTVLSSIGINYLVGEQYLSIILPGTAFKSIYNEHGINDKQLSRALATGGADINAMVPWGVSGVFIAGTLNVNPFSYIQFSFYTLLHPILVIILGFTLITWKSKKNNISNSN